MRLIHAPLHRRPGRRYANRQPDPGPGIAPTSPPRAPRRARPCGTRPRDNQPATAPLSSTPTPRRRSGGRRLVLITEVAALAALLSASAAHADTIQTSGQVLALAGSVGQVLTNIRNWVMGILAGLATVFLSIGGVRYVMGGGDPGEIEKAKAAFKAAGIGYGLAALAPLIVTVLQGIVGS
jgi:type IV secretion system pilin